jgi:hypothetical protein
MAWRARFRIFSFANLPEHFMVENVSAKTTLVAEDLAGRAFHYVDLSIESDNLEDAFFESLDRISQIEDAVAFLSFGPVNAEFVSLTVASIKPDEWFDIVLPSDGFRRSRCSITSEKLEKLCLPKEKEAAIALHAFKQGVSSASPYNVVTELWTSVETLASKQGANENNYVEHTCEKCGHKKKGMPRTHPYINSYFLKSKAKDKSEQESLDFSKRSGTLRHTLVHGGKLRNSDLRREAEFIQAPLQAAAATAISMETDIKTDARHCHHLGIPYIHLQMKRVDQEQVEMRGQIFKVSTVLSEIPPEFRDTDAFSIDVGLFLPHAVQPLNPDALPTLI